MHAPRITSEGLVDPGCYPPPVDDRPTIPLVLELRGDRRRPPAGDRTAQVLGRPAGGERGMIGDGHVLELAERAAEAVREMNHRTRDPGGFTGPAELYWLVGDLASLARRLPQLLGQLDRWLQTEHDAGRVRADTGAEANPVVAAAGADLADAGDAARELALALDAAQQHLAHLGATDPGHANSGRA